MKSHPHVVGAPQMPPQHPQHLALVDVGRRRRPVGTRLVVILYGLGEVPHGGLVLAGGHPHLNVPVQAAGAYEGQLGMRLQAVDLSKGWEGYMMLKNS